MLAAQISLSQQCEGQQLAVRVVCSKQPVPLMAADYPEPNLLLSQPQQQQQCEEPHLRER